MKVKLCRFFGTGLIKIYLIGCIVTIFTNHPTLASSCCVPRPTLVNNVKPENARLSFIAIFYSPCIKEPASRDPTRRAHCPKKGTPYCIPSNLWYYIWEYIYCMHVFSPTDHSQKARRKFSVSTEKVPQIIPSKHGESPADYSQ